MEMTGTKVTAAEVLCSAENSCWSGSSHCFERTQRETKLWP